ncbi:hypothetical protein EJB05_15856, partial [Eragrostis curvula]
MPTFEELLDSDQLRVGYIQRKASAARMDAVGTQKEASTVPTTLGSSLDSLQYVITISFGTPPDTQTVLIDTDSDVSWVQCVPCLQCHPQADPLFDPSSSSTYSPFSCSSVACLLLNEFGCSSSQCQYTVRSRRIPTYYFVVLEGITGNGQLLDVAPSVFSAGGTILDSGTIITRLPPTAYAELSSAFKAAMVQYPAAPPRSLFDTCFEFTGLTSVTVPPVSLVFSGGAVVDLDPNGIIFNGCLAFAANRDDRSLGIIGNVQQRTFEVLYD